MVDAEITFPDYGDRVLTVSFVVDTGAQNVVLAPLDARRLEAQLGISVYSLPQTSSGIHGVGGAAPAWSIPSVVSLGSLTVPITLLLMQPPPPVQTLLPSLMGREILQHLAVLVDRANDLVVMYE